MYRICVLLALLLFSVRGQAAQAVFAGGSFWVMEALFAGRSGITQVEPGWIKAAGQQQIRQAVRVHYDDDTLSYGDLLRLYWQAVDYLDGGGQHCDRGSEFSPAIYVQGPLQLKWARQSRSRLRLELGRAIAVRILPAGDFVVAADRHRQYSVTHPLLFFAYRQVCGYPDGRDFSMQPLSAGHLHATAQWPRQSSPAD